MKPTLTLLVAMLVAGGAHAGDVFKTTDSKGQRVYTDRPATLREPVDGHQVIEQVFDQMSTVTPRTDTASSASRGLWRVAVRGRRHGP